MLLVPEAKSPLSMRATRRPRREASRATPAPVMPPPMTTRSKEAPARADRSRFMLGSTAFKVRRDGPSVLPDRRLFPKKGSGARLLLVGLSIRGLLRPGAAYRSGLPEPDLAVFATR